LQVADCSEGLRGTCEVRIVEGAADHRDQVLGTAERAAQSRMMACCSRAAGTRIVLAL
jgi:ferredoxin